MVAKQSTLLMMAFPLYKKFSIFWKELIFMNTLTIDNKKYVVLSQKEYDDLRMKAVSKAIPAKKNSLKEGKKLANKITDKRAKGK